MYKFQDPEISQAFMEVSQNPANISKYQNNPKIQRVIQRMTEKFGMFGGAGSGDGSGHGGGPGGAGGAGGAGAPPSQPDLGVD